ncbi:hypothetical protein, partial [Fusicatenibacter saccharivorans]
STPKTLINSLHATARNFDTPSYWTLTHYQQLPLNVAQYKKTRYLLSISDLFLQLFFLWGII